MREVGAEANAFSLAAFGILEFTLVAGGTPARVDVALVSGDFFTLLGAVPAHGRLLTPLDNDSGAAVAVVSHRAWTTRFGRDPDLIGRTMRLGPQLFTVGGVAANPLPGPAHNPDFWVPLSAVEQLLPDFDMLGPFGAWLETVGRLGASTSRGDAAVLAALARDRLPADVAAVRAEDWRFVARPVSHVRLGPEYQREAARFLTVLVVITGIFLLAACSNMVLLLLTRGAEQAHELAVRRALGASRRDLVRPLAAKLLVLVGARGLAALVALRWVEPVLSALPQLAKLAPLGAATTAPGTGAALWTLAVAGATWAAVCLGLLVITWVRPPVLQVTPAPRATGRGGRQRVLMAAQVAVSAVLVIAAGLLLRSAHGIASIPRGFVPEDVVVAQRHTAGYSDAEGDVLYRRLLDELQAGGPVVSAALAWHTPFSEFTLSPTPRPTDASREPTAAGRCIPRLRRCLGEPPSKRSGSTHNRLGFAYQVAFVRVPLPEFIGPSPACGQSTLRTGGSRAVNRLTRFLSRSRTPQAEEDSHDEDPLDGADRGRVPRGEMLDTHRRRPGR